jgi:hypothetical protein
MQKSVFLAVHASLRYVGLIMLAACTYSPGFFASYWSAGLETFLKVSGLASHCQTVQIVRQRLRIQ